MPLQLQSTQPPDKKTLPEKGRGMNKDLKQATSHIFITERHKKQRFAAFCRAAVTRILRQAAISANAGFNL